MNKHLIQRGIVSATSALTLAGCAGVDIYTERVVTPTTPKTGIPIYGSKPYLLVARTEAKDKPVEVSIVHLRDAANVVYAVPRSGLGLAKTSLSLSNGQLTSFNQESDSKVAELITSLSSIITARGGADKAGAEADAIRHGMLQSGEDATKAAAQVQKVVDDIKRHRKTANSPIASLTDIQKGRIDDVLVPLEAAAKGLANLSELTQAADRIATVKAQADELEKIVPGEGLPPKLLAAQALVRQWATDLRTVVKPVEAPKPVKSAFELYEIKQTATEVKLIPVTATAEMLQAVGAGAK